MKRRVKPTSRYMMEPGNDFFSTSQPTIRCLNVYKLVPRGDRNGAVLADVLPQ